MYTMYGRTHLYIGFEVLMFVSTLFVVRDCKTCSYGSLTWNSWFFAFVMILCPLWFNPFIFNLSKVRLSQPASGPYGSSRCECLGPWPV